MGRRHIHHRCAFKALKPDDRPLDDGFTLAYSYCGQLTGFKAEQRQPGAGKRATCPKCAAALGKLNLKRHGDRVRLERITEGTLADRYRSAWEFYLDGVLRGYILNERGFGEGWNLARLATDADRASYYGHGGYVSGTRPAHSWDADKVEPERPIQPLHYGARDAMACGAVRAVAAGLLPTIAEQEEAARLKAEREAERLREREAERAVNLAAIERLRAEHSEQVETATLGLAELGARPDLTNLERAGIEAALVLVRRSRPA